MGYYIIYPLFWLLGILPRFVKKGLAGFIYLVVYKIAKYRVDVVRDNLANAFKEKSEEELLSIEKKFYHHLSTIAIETFTLASISRRAIRKSMVFENKDELFEKTKGKSCIFAMAHYGTWEYVTSWCLHGDKNKIYAVYQPLHDKNFDRYYYKVRSRFGAEPLPMANVGRTIYNQIAAKQNVTLALIADQSAPKKAGQHWTMFFGRMTPFFNGIEKFALKFSMPVAFMHIEKVGFTRYIARYEIIYDGEEKVESGEITERYVRKLEEMISENPELWMWSHKRWKHKYE